MKKYIIIISTCVLLIFMTFFISSTYKKKNLQIENMSLIINYQDMEQPYNDSIKSNPIILRYNLKSNDANESEYVIKGYNVIFLLKGVGLKCFCIAEKEKQFFVLKTNMQMQVFESIPIDNLPIFAYKYDDSMALLFNENGIGTLYLVNFESSSIEYIIGNICIDEWQQNLYIKGNKILYKDINEKWFLLADNNKTATNIPAKCIGFIDNETVLLINNKNVIHEYNLQTGIRKNYRYILHDNVNNFTISRNGGYLIATVAKQWASPGDGLFLYVYDLSIGVGRRVKYNIDYPYSIEEL